MKLNKRAIEILLATKGLSWNELNELSCVTQRSLFLAVNGKREPTPLTVGKIAKALGVYVVDIILKEGE